MPDFSNLPLNMFAKGDVLRASELNKLADAVRRSQLLPGSFQSGQLLLQAIGGSPAEFDLKTVVLTATIAAASWSSSTVKLTPTIDDANAFEWVAHEDGDGTYTYNDAEPVSVENWFTSAITVTSGKGKIAQVAGGRIFNVDCIEISLPGDS